MTGRELSEALRSGQRVYGTAILSTCARWPAFVKSAGVDFVFLDTEHVPLGRETLSWMCQTYRALGLPPVVRIPSPDPYQASMALDGGAVGIIVPYVETADQVRALRGAVKLNPLKGKTLRSVLAGEEDLSEETASYLRERNEDRVMIVNVESTHALEALDELLDVEGLDAVLVGPHDLSISLGVPERYDSVRFQESVHLVIERARQRQIGVGVHFSSAIEHEIAWARLGANLIVHSSDAFLFEETMKRDLAAIKSALNEA